jgi:HlyD family secretion protein
MQSRRWIAGAVAAAMLLGAAAYYWFYNSRDTLPNGIVSTNGRLEAEKVEVATKQAGRIAAIHAEEGEMVDAGAVVAKMDTAELDALLRQAEARVRSAVETQAEAKALIAQRESQRSLAEKELERGLILHDKGYFPTDKLDQRKAEVDVADAGLRAANAELQSAIAAQQAAEGEVQRLNSLIDDCVLKSPVRGRVQYKLAQPGEVLAAGGRVLTIIDIGNVYMTVFLPAKDAGRLTLGDDARLILDPVPQYVIPAKVTYVATESQFTPKTVETQDEREKLMFRVKLAIDAALLKKYESEVKTGVRGMAYMRTSRDVEWPESLVVKLPAS